jgi:hypothetical protein
MMLAKMHYRLSTKDAEPVLHDYIAPPHDAAALFQRAVDPQRAGPGAAAPGQPAVRQPLARPIEREAATNRV